MLKKVFTIYDVKSFTYGPPVCFGKVGEALRWFCDLIAEPQSTICKYPNDFQLFEIGEYEDTSAELISAKPHLIGNAAEYTKVKPVVYEPAATNSEEK